MFRKSILSASSFATLMALTGVTAHAQTAINPVLEYNFNDSGTTTLSTGSDTSASTTLTFITKSSAATATDLHGAAGSGVSGFTGDIAFNNTAANAMGRAVNATGGGQARNGAAGATSTGGPTSANGLSSFTIQGWFKTDGTEVIGGDARIFSDANAANTGIYVSAPNTGFSNIRLGVNNSFVDSPTSVPTGSPPGTISTFAGDAGTWTFYAVTYDSTATSSNVSFYRGTTTTGVTLLSTAFLNPTSVLTGVNSSFFALGNFGDPSSAAVNLRPLDGFLDDTRLYGATTGSSGALNLAQLQTIETADIGNTEPMVLAPAPEPSQAAVLMLGVLGLAGLTLRARKRQALMA